MAPIPRGLAPTAKSPLSDKDCVQHALSLNWRTPMLSPDCYWFERYDRQAQRCSASSSTWQPSDFACRTQLHEQGARIFRSSTWQV